ncbi:helix-turn-helix domain-containing protein [Micromonospora sp. Llam7]|uniref:helix-turn-helix domain-containing protein n=1 Tax=Micromonospora tarapacensis TaxID=2835305 RepID=UPI001C8330E4|nr:helix-turn-helix domain-containing protein [Micromonospora tarapacensis]MBX7268957.1 helix-turn-helix domain-containing protein [Micromonospora tarapacensis]
MTTSTATTPQSQVWTEHAVRALGMTTDVETAGEILGIGRTKAYELAKTDEFPVKILRIGRRYLVSVPALLKLLGVD